jgi:predicted DNA-binding protein (UPF0251 family)
MTQKKIRKPLPEPVNKGGRPRVLINDEETREKLNVIASRLHTQPEAAALLGVSLATFEGFLRANKDIRDIWEGGALTGRAAVRRMQFASAQKGNVQMQIWLGKQYIGQKDKAEVETKHDIADSVKELWALVGSRRREVSDG